MDYEVIFIGNRSEEERKAYWNHQNELLKWAHSLTEEQIDFLCNGGWYNSTIKGYLISAAKEAEFTEEQTKKLLQGLRYVLDTKEQKDADRIYREF